MTSITEQAARAAAEEWFNNERQHLYETAGIKPPPSLPLRMRENQDAAVESLAAIITKHVHSPDVTECIEVVKGLRDEWALGDSQSKAMVADEIMSALLEGKASEHVQSPSVDDYEEVLADHRRLVRELDVLLNGENAAPQASLVDIVTQLRTLQGKAPVNGQVDANVMTALERIWEVAKAGGIQTKDQYAAERFALILGRAEQLLRTAATTPPSPEEEKDAK